MSDPVGADPPDSADLSVTPVTEADLELSAVVRIDAPLAEVGQTMDDSGWAVVLDREGGLAG